MPLPYKCDGDGWYLGFLSTADKSAGSQTMRLTGTMAKDGDDELKFADKRAPDLDYTTPFPY